MMGTMNFFYQHSFEKRKKDSKRLGVLAVVMLIVLFLYPAVKFYDIMGLEYELEDLRIELERSRVDNLESEYILYKSAFDQIKMAVDKNELMDLVVKQADYLTPSLLIDLYDCFDGEVTMSNFSISGSTVTLSAESITREDIYILMHKIRNTKSFEKVRLSGVNQNDESSIKRFDLTFEIKGVGPIVEVE